MKRILAVSVVWFALSLSLPVFAEEDVSDVMITKIQGDVSLIREGSVLPAKEGAVLKAGDTLKTAENVAQTVKAALVR